ncbi:hypothetical protein B0T26DRAFT_749419 [Lasiosphaeria miniovina]|uniref:FAD/NAD(P)-binding domain-containing protein n=1 Tax=Lasiosphaeria miniovina TaxID=1954250 RepID=A0AA40ATX2_9PEZI|nr:uncharacterized protein B0T26DRAFT_749419 [Lasiosphaeria miniovina]KAK0721952.1 hypothetical protein B0T26DRAFT_749419 [Lasiosphaeria miniovina]
MLVYASKGPILASGRPQLQATLLAPRVTEPFTGLWRSARRGDGFGAAVAGVTILSKFAPIALAYIPFRSTLTWRAHQVCAWSSVATLLLMIALLGISLAKFIVVGGGGGGGGGGWRKNGSSAMPSLADRLLSSVLPSGRLHRPKVAIIGAGITGGSTTRQASKSIIMYRFHPSVKWDEAYPNRQRIVEQVRDLWERYGLRSKTKFNTRVDEVYQDDRGRWIVNNTTNGHFEGIIAAIGTCGEPKMPQLPGLADYKGPVYHSSDLTGKPAKGKTMVVIGGGASAGASKVKILARSDKWIIPRNTLCNILLSLNVFGQETALSWIPEALLRRLFYRDLAPATSGIFTDTPMVNSDVMDKLRSGSAAWIKCDIERFTAKGVLARRRSKDEREEEIAADMVAPYAPPNWYLQTFPPRHPSVSLINCTYRSAIGTVGNWHVGIYTRLLLMFLVNPLTRPSPFWMCRWIDMTRLLKRSSPLVLWLVFCVAFNPFRWKWALFVFLGTEYALPARVVEAEDKMRLEVGINGYADADADADVGLGF